LQRSSNLTTGFVDLATGIAANPPMNSYRDATATGNVPYFYRLRLENGAQAATPVKFVTVRADSLGGVRLDWLSTSNQNYTLQRSSDLKNGFTNLATALSATPPTNSFWDISATGAGPYFYRLRLEQ
jgi:hypothetical protein